MSGIRPRRILFALAARAAPGRLPDDRGRRPVPGRRSRHLSDQVHQRHLRRRRPGRDRPGVPSRRADAGRHLRPLLCGLRKLPILRSRGRAPLRPGTSLRRRGSGLPERRAGRRHADAGIEPRMGVQHDRRDQVPAGTGGDPVRGVSAAARRQRQQPDVLRRRSGGPREQAASPPPAGCRHPERDAVTGSSIYARRSVQAVGRRWEEWAGHAGQLAQLVWATLIALLRLQISFASSCARCTSWASRAFRSC